MTCPLCTNRAKSEIWRNDHFYLIDADDPNFPCFLRLISCRHIAEQSLLSKDERAELWEILNIIEEEILKALKPTKINLAQFGNMVPHLHWHIIARWKDDSHFPECPWGPIQREVPASVQAERRHLMEALKPILKDTLTKKII